MSREGCSREETQVQLARTAPTPATKARRARARVRLPWSRLDTEYNQEAIDGDEASDYEIDEDPQQAGRWLRAVSSTPPSMAAS
eukprot:9230986-Alexandrium_andersonii.AAC.1